MNNISEKLDEAFAEAESKTIGQIESNIPQVQLSSLRAWSFGSYGWTSPVNLLITAAWYKWLFPEQDVCKIWANDHSKKKIDGGFAIRSNDERYTVPLVAKTRITNGFCSPNSGMQGSRAIEKMRGQGRIDRDSPIEQAVSFDMSLFQNIINDINDCDSAKAYQYLLYLLRIGIDIRNERIAKISSLAKNTTKIDMSIYDVLEFCENISDPQFVKLLAIALLEPLVSKFHQNLETGGIEGSKTAADTQSKSPGDFWFYDQDKNPVIGVEVKDKSKNIGFEIIGAIENRKENNPTLTTYFAITASKIAVKEAVIKDKFWLQNIARIRNDLDLNIITLSFLDICSLLIFLQVDHSKILHRANKLIIKMDDLKKDTMDKWIEFVG